MAFLKISLVDKLTATIKSWATGALAAKSHTHSSSDITNFAGLGFPDYARAWSIRDTKPSSDQSVDSDGYLIVTFYGSRHESIVYPKVVVTPPGSTTSKNVLAGIIFGESHTYKFGGGATVIPLQKGSKWHLTDTNIMDGLHWQWIPVKTS